MNSDKHAERVMAAFYSLVPLDGAHVRPEGRGRFRFIMPSGDHIKFVTDDEYVRQAMDADGCAQAMLQARATGGSVMIPITTPSRLTLYYYSPAPEDSGYLMIELPLPAKDIRLLPRFMAVTAACVPPDRPEQQ